MENNADSGEKLLDKEVVKVGANENKTPATTSEGEYSEEKKAVMSAMKSYYGEDVAPDSEDYTVKLEKMVATDFIPKASKLKSYDEANVKLIAMMEDEPELSGILSDMSKGAKFTQVIGRYVDPMTLPKDESDIAEWEKNAKMREEKHEARMKREAELAENEERSIAVIEKFVADKKLEGENVTKFAQLVADFLDRAYSGDITEQFLEVMYYYMNRDKEIAEASEMAALKAKNEKIATEKFSEKEYAGDGLPSLAGSGAGSVGKAEENLDPITRNLKSHLEANQPIIRRG